MKTTLNKKQTNKNAPSVSQALLNVNAVMNKLSASLPKKELAFKELLKAITIFKEDDTFVLVFRAEHQHLLLDKESNNRATTEAYVKHQFNIAQSRKMMGNCSGITVCIIDDKFYVAEGLNRTKAFKKNGETIIAFVSQASFSDTFTNMNIFVKPLKNKELLDHCSKEGAYTDHYKVLIAVEAYHKTITKVNPKNAIQPCLIRGLLSTAQNRLIAKQLIESKKFTTSPELITYTEKVTKQIYDLQNVGLNCGIGANEGMIYLINELGAEYNHKQMIANLKKANNIAVIRSVKTNVNILRDIHNGIN